MVNMETKKSKCWECQCDFGPFQLREVVETVTIKKQVCNNCYPSGQENMLDIETNKRQAARATAWNSGNGWAI
jgi:protein-arginine kinase activator protein McsA